MHSKHATQEILQPTSAERSGLRAACGSQDPPFFTHISIKCHAGKGQLQALQEKQGKLSRKERLQAKKAARARDHAGSDEEDFGLATGADFKVSCLTD